MTTASSPTSAFPREPGTESHPSHPHPPLRVVLSLALYICSHTLCCSDVVVETVSGEWPIKLDAGRGIADGADGGMVPRG